MSARFQNVSKREMKKAKKMQIKEPKTYQSLAKKTAKLIAKNYEYNRVFNLKCDYGNAELIKLCMLDYEIYTLYGVKKYKFSKLSTKELENLIKKQLEKWGYEILEIEYFYDHIPGSEKYSLYFHVVFSC